MNPRRSFLDAVAYAFPIGLGLAVFYAYWAFQHAWEIQFGSWKLLFVLPAAAAAYVIAVLAWRPYRASPGASSAHVFFSRAADLGRMPRGWRARFMNLPAGLRVVSVVLVGLALARPQRVDAPETLELSGIDIVIVLDVSGSMRARDLQPTRLDAAKEVIDRFIERRPNDRIGFVVFGREAFPALAPTLDKTALRRIVDSMEIGTLSEQAHNGTAIGDGLGAALNYLRRSDARSKVVVLLTDGANNAGHVDPNHASQFASALRVKVYTVLMGQADDVPVENGRDIFGRPVIQMMHFPVDPALLQHIANETHAQFFRATDRASLDEAFHAILDHLERSRIADAGVRHQQLFPWLIVPALLLLALEILLSATVLRRFP